MTYPSEKGTIHTKGYYRVVLEGIDSAQDSPDSFALELSMRIPISLPHARQMANRLPQVVKDGLTAAQANKLKGVIETIGGKARLEAHVVTPSEPDDTGSDLRTQTQGIVECPSCGWQEAPGATHCSICLRRFRNTGSGTGTLKDRCPEENPLVDRNVHHGDRWSDITAVVRRFRLPILLAVIAVLVIILVSK